MAATRMFENWLRKSLWLIAINFMVFISMSVSALLLLTAGNDMWSFYIKPLTKTKSIDSRAALPAYADHDRAARVFKDQKKKEANYRYVPFLEWRHRQFASETVNIDVAGNRKHTKGQQNNEATTTVGFFGGSSMWGSGVDDDSTIPAFFDQLTDEFHVTNYGERGYTSRQNLDHLINLIVDRGAPQIAIFYNGYNEVWAHCNYAVSRSLNAHMKEGRFQDALLTVEGTKSKTYEVFIAPVLKFFAQFWDSPEKANEFACSSDPERAEAVANMIVENWRMAELLVSGYGGKFYAFLQPTAHTGSPRIDYLPSSEVRKQADSEYQVVYQLVRKKIYERNLSWIKDLSVAFDINKPIFIDEVHVAPEGNRIIAQQIISIINDSAPASPALVARPRKWGNRSEGLSKRELVR